MLLQILKCKGFTIVELLVVFTIMITLSIAGVAAYSRANDNQRLNVAVSQVTTLLQKAKIRTQNQTSPPNCTKLKGYEVRFCTDDSLVTCEGEKAYELDAICAEVGGDVAVLIDEYSFPPEVILDAPATTTGVVGFEQYTGGVRGNGTVVLEHSNGKSKQILITTGGNIQIQ